MRILSEGFLTWNLKSSVASGLRLCKILVGQCPVLRGCFVGCGSQSIHGTLFLSDGGVKKKTLPNSAVEKRPHLGNQGTFSCCWGTVLLEAKMPERGFSSMLFMQLIIAMSSLAYTKGKKGLTRQMDGYSSPGAWGGCLCEPSQNPKTRRKFSGSGN